LIFDTEKLESLCGRTNKLPREDHALVCCVVSRGVGDSLARAVLELGICVPLIFFGTGVGLRDKLGLLRITVPVEKEVIWFITPLSDAEMVEKTLIPRARLDIPGKGFLYKCYIHAPVVNLRIRHGKRLHAATMDQVITAMDEIQGSSDWRRLGSKILEAAKNKTKTESQVAHFFIGEEAEVEMLRKTAMNAGARGATLNHVEMRSYSGFTQDEAKESHSQPESHSKLESHSKPESHSKLESHSRQLCDIITSKALEEKLKEPLSQTGLFENGRSCVLKAFDVDMPAVLRRRDT
jgi:hypothetical protein